MFKRRRQHLRGDECEREDEDKEEGEEEGKYSCMLNCVNSNKNTKLCFDFISEYRIMS